MGELFEAFSRVRSRSERAKKVWSFLEDPELVRGGWLYTRMSSFVIVMSAILPLLQQTEQAPLDAKSMLMLEIAFDVYFAGEVVIRFATCPNRISFCLSGYTLLDVAAGMLALLVRNLSHATLFEAEVARNPVLMGMICGLPVLRLLKLLRRFDTFHLILKACYLAFEALPVLLYILAILVLVFASVIFIVEPRHNVGSMASALWLTIVTVGTIGYGDITPYSTAGHLVVSLLVVVSALYMAIPIGIVGKAFSTVWDDRYRLLLMHRTRNRFLSSGYKAKDVPAMFFSFDMDNDGQLNLAEFLAMMSQLQVEISPARMLELFETFDNDDSGTIDDHEFVRTLFPDAFATIYGSPQEEENALRVTQAALPQSTLPVRQVSPISG